MLFASRMKLKFPNWFLSLNRLTSKKSSWTTIDFYKIYQLESDNSLFWLLSFCLKFQFYYLLLLQLLYYLLFLFISNWNSLDYILIIHIWYIILWSNFHSEYEIYLSNFIVNLYILKSFPYAQTWQDYSSNRSV